LELRVCAENARTLLVAPAKSQSPLLLDLDVPVCEVIDFPNLFHLFKWDILRRTKDRVLRGKNLMRPLLIKGLLLEPKIQHLHRGQSGYDRLMNNLLKLGFGLEV